MRGNAIGLFKALITDELEESSSSFAAAELLSLPKTGKSNGPDHRTSLYSMLSYLQPSIAVSSTLIKDATPLLAKETNDTAISTLAAALPPHLSFLLSKNQDLPSEITTLIAKEMNNTKPVIRHAFCSLAGASLMAISSLDTDAGLAFAAALLPALESNLKAVASNPLNASGGPLEGYIALSCLLGPIRSCSKFSKHGFVLLVNMHLLILWFLSRIYLKDYHDPIIVCEYRKAFLFALGQSLPEGIRPCGGEVAPDSPISRDSSLQQGANKARGLPVSNSPFCSLVLPDDLHSVQAGLLFIHLAVNSGSPESRRNVLTTLSSLSSQFAKLTNDILYDALVSFLANGKTFTKASSAEGPDGTWNKHSRLSTLLLSCFNFSEDVDATLREDILVQVLVVAHHEHVCSCLSFFSAVAS